MNRELSIDFAELDQRPDPSTPPELLPPHLRKESRNRREERCRRAALRHGTRLLSPKQQEALHMRYTLGMSFRHLSAELGISRTAAERRIKRSKEQLKNIVELCMLVEKELGDGENE